MKLAVAFLIMILGICSVIASPKVQDSNDKASSNSSESTGPGV